MDEDQRSNRQIARRERRDAGDRSAELARALMQLRDAAIAKLEVEDELLDAIRRARRVTAPGARRRAERELAGALRRDDLADLAARLERVQRTGAGDDRHLHAAERWRERLIVGGVAAAAELPGGVDGELGPLVARAQSERATGKPPGAARALFRHIVAALKAQEQVAAAADADAADATDADEDRDDDRG
jgi:ribosome-associated protein